MHIASAQQPRSTPFATIRRGFAAVTMPSEASYDDSAWRTAATPAYRGGRVVSRHEQTWNSLCAMVIEVRAEAEISAPLQAQFTRVCIALEEIGGPFQITSAGRPAGLDAAARGTVSVIPAGAEATGHAKNLRFMRHLLLQLDGPTVAALDERVDLGSTLAPRLMVPAPRLQQLGHLIAKECVNGEPQDELYRDGLTVAVLGALRGLAGAAGDRRSGSGGLAPWQVRRVTGFLQERLAERVDMADLAQVVGLSKAHFARAFKVSTGLPPHRWLLNARIGKAQEMLIDNDLPLAELALTVGFADQAHFSRTFGSIVGTSPRAWQRARRR